MKTGIIVYIAGDDDRGPEIDLEKQVKRLELEADRVELVSRSSGHFDVSDAWWYLTTKGMNHVKCAIGELTESGHIQLTGRELRLSG
jgi:hypothetical protein